MPSGQKLSTLPVLATLDSADIFSVVDVSLPVNRVITYSNLLSQLDSEVTITESQISDLQAYALGATTMTFSGTANEVEISGGTQDLSSNRTWTIGLPADVSITNDISVGSAAPTAIAHLTRKDYVDGELSTGLALKLDKTGGTISSNLTISGNLTVNGTTTTINTELVTADSVINMNDGEVGSGVTLGYAGLKIDRGSSNDYWLGFYEVRDAFSIGEITALSSGQIATTQVVATRVDSPTDTHWAFWDNSNSRLDFINPQSLTADLRYSADHSGSYTSRSLVDKDYVDSQISGSGVTIGSQYRVPISNSGSTDLSYRSDFNFENGVLKVGSSYPATWTYSGTVIQYGSSTKYVELTNSTTGSQTPTNVAGGAGLLTTNNASTSESLFLHGRTSVDTGSVPVTVIGSSVSSAVLSTRPVLGVYNYQTKLLEIAADGTATFSGHIAYQTEIPTAKVANYTLVEADNGKIIEVNGTYSVILPATALSNGFSVQVVNIGTTTVTLDRSTNSETMYWESGTAGTTNASLADQFTAATIYCDGSTYTAFGKLT